MFSSATGRSPRARWLRMAALLAKQFGLPATKAWPGVHSLQWSPDAPLGSIPRPGACETMCVCVWCVWEPGLVLSSPAHSCDLVLACFRCCSWAYALLSRVEPSLNYKVLVLNRLYKKYTKAETLLIPAPSPFPPLYVGNNLQYKILP